MKVWMKGCFLLVLLSFPVAVAGEASDMGRFFYSGDGRLSLLGKKNGAAFSGRYRYGAMDYDPAALKLICRVFQAPYGGQRPGLALRLIEFLDYLQDQLNPGTRITITSGYRDPQYNQSLRNRGGIVAKASLHQYGMAADIIMDGVPAKRVWDHVKALGFGGVGYYHGQTAHVDVGPARFWDEKTSGVGSGLSDDNKLIGLVTQYDIYRPGERLVLRFTRMTAFPIGVARHFDLEPVTGTGAGTTDATTSFSPTVSIPAKDACLKFYHIDEMARLSWPLPSGLPTGSYRVRARFCQNPWETMPREIVTPIFQVVYPE